MDIEKVIYLTKDFHEKTPEGEVLDDLGLNKLCCRRHILTHVDIE
jgi:DNA-directed RNA polymerase I, II, and III subunit RPABC5